MSSEIIVLIAALGGAIIGSVTTLIVQFVRSKQEDTRHKRELIFRIAVENFKQACEMARASSGKVYPFEDFLIHAAILAEKLSKNTFSTANTKETMEEIDAIMKQVRQFRNSHG